MYQVEAGKHYIAMILTPVGNRFRVMFSTINVSGMNQVSGIYIGTDTNNPSTYSVTPVYSPSNNGYITIFKTNQGQSTVKTYLLCLENLL